MADKKPHWHVYAKTSDGVIFVMKTRFDSLRAAKKVVKEYSREAPDWLAEMRVYRFEADDTCETCDEAAKVAE